MTFVMRFSCFKLFPEHNVEDLHVGARHSDPAHAPDIRDCLLHIRFHDPLARRKDKAVLGEEIPHQRRVDRAANLGGAARLRAVADHATNRADRVDDEEAAYRHSREHMLGP